MALDYASILQAGQNLVPDLQEQMFRKQELQQRQTMMEQQQQQRALQMQEAALKQQRAAEFRARLAGVIDSNDPRAIAKLMMEYPEFADSIKPGYDAISNEAKTRNLTQLGSAYQLATGGDSKGAAAVLRKRYDADVAAGQADETTKELLDALESDDPVMQRRAASTLGMVIASQDPAKFTEAFKALNPAEKIDPTQREYQWRVGQFGQAAADRWLAVQDTKLVPVQEGGSIYNAADLIPPTGGGIVATREDEERPARSDTSPGSAPEFANDPRDGGQPKGGDQSDPREGVPAPALGPNGLPATLTPQQYQATIASMGKAKTDAWLKQNGITVSGGSAGPVRVRSVQEARKLPSGTIFITPDGRTMRKP